MSLVLCFLIFLLDELSFGLAPRLGEGGILMTDLTFMWFGAQPCPLGGFFYFLATVFVYWQSFYIVYKL